MSGAAIASSSRLRGNLLANLLANAWTPIIGLLFVPLYTAQLGMEAFGLVGLFIAVNAIANSLGSGLANVLNRELARLSVVADRSQEMRDLTITLERVYWLLALAVGLIMAGVSPLAAHYWIRPEELSTQTVTIALLLMGLTLTLQFPNAFYSSGLAGLQHQVSLSVCSVIMNTLRFAGAAVVLVYFSRTITAFFAWQAIVGALHSLVLRLLLMRGLPGRAGADKVRRELLQRVRSFLGGTTIIGLMALVLTQLDMVILSRVLTLERLGYYTLAATAAKTLYFIVGSVFTAFSPRLAQLVSLQDRQQLRQVYHLSCQAMAVLILPAAIMGALFSRELLMAWTADPIKAENSYLVLSLLLVGTGLNALSNMPYALQLANGHTRLAVRLNLVAVAVLAPMIVVLAILYGPVGAAAVWVTLNVFYAAVGVTMTHRRFMPGESLRWLTHDVLLPLVPALAVALAARLLLPVDLGRLPLIGALMAAGLVCLVTTCLFVPDVRRAALGLLIRK